MYQKTTSNTIPATIIKPPIFDYTEQAFSKQKIDQQAHYPIEFGEPDVAHWNYFSAFRCRQMDYGTKLVTDSNLTTRS